MRRLRALAITSVVVIVACSPGQGIVTTATTSLPPATSSTTVPPDFAALCHGYLVLLRSGDDGPLRQELTEPDQIADLDTMMSTEGEFEAIAAAALRLEEAVVARCADRFSLSVEPADDNPTALTRFLEALVAGDQAAAEAVAWENVVAQFTWSSVEGGEVVIEGDSATMPIGPARSVVCTAAGGVVVSCRYREA